MTMTPEQQETPRVESNGVPQGPTEVRLQDTAGWCVCPRSDDNWRCQDRPRYDSDPDGRCCALGGTKTLTGTDRWDGYSARVLAQNPCEGTGGTDADV